MFWLVIDDVWLVIDGVIDDVWLVIDDVLVGD